MNIGTKSAIAAAGALALTAALAGCPAGSGQRSGGSNPAPKSSFCVPESGDCGGSSGGVKVSANPQPSNAGVGTVTGACRFSIQGPPADTTGGSGLKPKKTSPMMVIVAGIVWGYCTDTIHDFTIDMHIYGAPTGDASGDFTKDPKAHELSHSENHTAPGPIPTPFAVTAPCVPGVEYQLVWYIVATDPAGNFVGGGPYGGRIRAFSASDCGIVPGPR